MCKREMRDVAMLCGLLTGVNISRLTGARMYTLYRNSVNRPDQVQGRSLNQTQRGDWVRGRGLQPRSP